MCEMCDAFDVKIRRLIEEHQKQECNNPVCPMPKDVVDSEFLWLACAHWRLGNVMDRMNRTRGVVNKPGEIPSQLIRDWEAHVAAAVELIGKARARRAEAEASALVAGYIDRLRDSEPKGTPS